MKTVTVKCSYFIIPNVEEITSIFLNKTEVGSVFNRKPVYRVDAVYSQNDETKTHTFSSFDEKEVAEVFENWDKAQEILEFN